MYDPTLSYERNFAEGPFPEWCFPHHRFPAIRFAGEPRFDFMGKPVFLPLGVPAGPLLQSRFVRVAFEAGLSVCTYKTVRSRAWPSHAHPNVLSVRPFDRDVTQLSQDRSEPRISDASAVVDRRSPLGVPSQVIPKVCATPLTAERASDAVSRSLESGALALSITNSFGVPSQDPSWWQADVSSLLDQDFLFGRELVVSFQGSRPVGGQPGAGGFDAFIRDAQRAQDLAVATGARVLEVNLSCPNEEGTPIYRDRTASVQLLRALAETRPTGVRLLAKIGSLTETPSSPECTAFVESCGPYVDGFSAINTVQSEIGDAHGQHVLGSGSAVGGVCGELIFAENLRMTELLAAARERMGVDSRKMFIVSVGGINSVDRFRKVRDAGADHVQAATACMWNLDLPRNIADALGVATQ